MFQLQGNKDLRGKKKCKNLMIPVKTSYVKILPPTINSPPLLFFLLLTTAQFFKEFLASPDDKLCELLLDQNSFEITAGVQDPVRANAILSPLKTDTRPFLRLL